MSQKVSVLFSESFGKNKLKRKTKRKKQNLKKLLSSFFIVALLAFTGCATYTIHDNRIRVHFMSKGDKAPFDGILLNSFTYQTLKTKAAENQRRSLCIDKTQK